MKKIYIIMALLVALSGLFCIDLQNFDNGETFGNIRTKINANNDTLDVYVNENIADIDTLQTDLDLAEVDIVELKRITETITVSAYVDSVSILVANGTYQKITNPFTNTILDGVTLGTNALVIGAMDADSAFIEILGSIFFESDKNNAKVTFGIMKNDVLIPGSNVSRTLAINVIGTMAGNSGAWVKEGDEISVVVKSSAANNTLLGVNIRTSMKAIKWSD